MDRYRTVAYRILEGQMEGERESARVNRHVVAYRILEEQDVSREGIQRDRNIKWHSKRVKGHACHEVSNSCPVP